MIRTCGYGQLSVARRKPCEDSARTEGKSKERYFATAFAFFGFRFSLFFGLLSPIQHLRFSHSEVGEPRWTIPTGILSVPALYLSGNRCVQKDFCPFSRSYGQGKNLTCCLFKLIDIGIGIAWVMVKKDEPSHAGLTRNASCHD